MYLVVVSERAFLDSFQFPRDMHGTLDILSLFATQIHSATSGLL